MIYLLGIVIASMRYGYGPFLSLIRDKSLGPEPVLTALAIVALPLLLQGCSWPFVRRH